MSYLLGAVGLFLLGFLPGYWTAKAGVGGAFVFLLVVCCVAVVLFALGATTGHQLTGRQINFFIAALGAVVTTFGVLFGGSAGTSRRDDAAKSGS